MSSPEGLFAVPTGQGSPEPAAPSAPATRVTGEAVNDMDLIEAVLTRAQEPGYVLINGRVWRRRTRRGEHIVAADRDEAAAVRQLLALRFLATGGQHRVRHRNRCGHATSVLLTDAARTRLRRWRNYARPISWGPRRHVA
jgi:hypothetical protein